MYLASGSFTQQEARKFPSELLSLGPRAKAKYYFPLHSLISTRTSFSVDVNEYIVAWCIWLYGGFFSKGNSQREWDKIYDYRRIVVPAVLVRRNCEFFLPSPREAMTSTEESRMNDFSSDGCRNYPGKWGFIFPSPRHHHYDYNYTIAIATTIPIPPFLFTLFIFSSTVKAGDWFHRPQLKGIPLFFKYFKIDYEP